MDSERVRLIDSDVAGGSDAVGTAVSEPSAVEINNDIKETEAFLKSSFNFSHNTAVIPPASANTYAVKTVVPLHSQSSEEFRGDDASQIHADYNPPNRKDNDGTLQSTSSGAAINQTISLHLPSQSIDSSLRQSGYNGLYETFSSNRGSQSREFSVTDTGNSHSLPANGFPESSGDFLHNSDYGDHVFSNHISSSFGGNLIVA